MAAASTDDTGDEAAGSPTDGRRPDSIRLRFDEEPTLQNAPFNPESRPGDPFAFFIIFFFGGGGDDDSGDDDDDDNFWFSAVGLSW